MRQVVAVGRENRRDLWAALALIREAVEAMAPVGALREPRSRHGPGRARTAASAAELVRGIQAIANARRG